MNLNKDNQKKNQIKSIFEWFVEKGKKDFFSGIYSIKKELDFSNSFLLNL